MSETALVVGYTWIDGAPALRLRKIGAWLVRPERLTGQIRFQITDARRCIGYSSGEGLTPCPDRAQPIRHQCAACERRDVFRPCMTCDGFRCPPLEPAMKQACERTHHLYLACFGDPRLKVGTASHGRREQRIIEQGPLAAARVAEGRGPRIKQLESLLAADEDFVEAMRRNRKTALLGAGMSVEQAQARIAEVAGQLRDRVPPEYFDLLHRPQFVSTPPLAQRARGWQVVELPIDEGMLVEGTVVGAIGHLLFVEESDGRFALDLGELKARVIDLRPEGGKRPTVQLGLF